MFVFCVFSFSDKQQIIESIQDYLKLDVRFNSEQTINNFKLLVYQLSC